MPGTANNLNAATNGTRLSRLTLGELPKQLTRVKRLVRQYRRDLEAACTNAHNEVSITHAHLIDEACAQEQHAATCRWLLNQRLDKMTVSDIVSCSGQIAKAKAARNRAIAQLKLDPDTSQDILAALYSPTAIDDDAATGEPESDDTDTTTTATDSTSEVSK